MLKTKMNNLKIETELELITGSNIEDQVFFHSKLTVDGKAVNGCGANLTHIYAKNRDLNLILDHANTMMKRTLTKIIMEWG